MVVTARDGTGSCACHIATYVTYATYVTCRSVRLAVIIIIIPVVVGLWWRNSSKFLEDGVMQNTAYRFYRQVCGTAAAPKRVLLLRRRAPP